MSVWVSCSSVIATTSYSHVYALSREVNKSENGISRNSPFTCVRCSTGS